MSPERISGEIDSENNYQAAKADIWSVGVLLFLLVFGKPPFDGKLNTSLVKSIKAGNIKLKENQWDENLQLFVQFISEMIILSPIDRINAVGALNHEFFRRDYQKLKKLSFKRKSLQNIGDFWHTLLIKDEIKNFAQFMNSAQHPAAMMEHIYEQRTASNIKQVLNGLSYITDDLQLARFMVESGFPIDFNEKTNRDPDCPEDLKINATNVCTYFLKPYEKAFENQIAHLLQYFVNKNDADAQINILQRCLMHALGVRELDPTLNDLTLASFLEVILG